MNTFSPADFSALLNLILIAVVFVLSIWLSHYKKKSGTFLTEEDLVSKKRGTRFVLCEIAEFNKVSSPRKSRGYLLEEFSSGLISKSKRWYRLEFNNVFLDGAHINTVYELCNSGLGKGKITLQEITYRKNLTPESV